MKLVGPLQGNCSQDQTSSAIWISSNPNVLYYTPPTGTAAGKSIPVPGNGYFVIGQTGQATVTGGYSSFNTGSNASLTVNVNGPAAQASPSPSPALFGNGAQGALTISANTDWTSTGVPGGTYYPQFTTLTINPGVTLTVPSGVNIRCTGSATINGKIVVAPWVTYAQAIAGQADISSSNISLNSITRPGFWGGGASSSTGGGSGGGTFGLRAASITIGSAGQIAADGQSGIAIGNSNGAGGGGGGVVVLVWSTAFTNQGSPGVSCRGGNGQSTNYPGATGGNGGGGGLVVLIGPGASTSNAITVSGGQPGSSGQAASTNPAGGGSSAGNGGSTFISIFQSPGSSAVGKDPAPPSLPVTTYKPVAGGGGQVVPTNTTNVAGTVPAAP